MWTKDQIKELLSRTDKAADKFLERALCQLFARQTADERSIGNTSHDNKIGFNAFDAPILSSFAKQIMDQMNEGEWNAFMAQCPGFQYQPQPREKRFITGQRLSKLQREKARKMILKYAGQLAVVANTLKG